MLEASSVQGVVREAECHVRDRLPRRNKSEKWPFRRADGELVLQTARKATDFFERFDSATHIVEASTAGTLGSAGVNSLVIVVLAHTIGHEALAKRLLLDEWRLSQDHPSLPFIERLAIRLRIELPSV